jgi:hypothetical protein
MVNLGGVVDANANTVTATVTYDNLHATGGAKGYSVVRGTAKDVGDHTFSLGVVPLERVPLSPWATALAGLAVALSGVWLVSRSARAPHKATELV